jgi:predicted glycogen debranching enzyme
MNPLSEWIETDGLGGFASGTVSGVRTRRYHALLQPALTPPTGRTVLVNGFDARVETPEGRFALSSQRYTPDVTHPDGTARLVAFTREPWPRWTYRLESGIEVVHELFAVHGAPASALSWSLTAPHEGVRLLVRPFLSGRDTHATHQENGGFHFEAEQAEGRIVWQPYAGLPRVLSLSNGEYAHDPAWYRNFQYDEERARELDYTEDLASPGELRWNLSRGKAVWILTTDGSAAGEALRQSDPLAGYEQLRDAEQERRRRFPGPLHRAADQYVVRRGEGSSIIAGYPWFSDWGRDTFIAVRGLCIATRRLDEARKILLAWAEVVSEGMLPNYFPEGGQTAEYNSVDASLWYVVAVHDLLRAARGRRDRILAPCEREALHRAVQQILTGYSAGTRFGIRMDADGLLAAGTPGVQLTWMDAKVGDQVITPRIGKPVEVQALWINALQIGGKFDPIWREPLARARESFLRRFWDASLGHLYDVVDVDHEPGRVDAALRPNQILAVGGLPFPVLDGTTPESQEIARRVVEAVEKELWTPLGLRSLAPAEPAYVPRYQGGVWSRDSAYHQGTVWPWLIGPFVEAWIRVNGGTRAARRAALIRYVHPLIEHLDDAGLGHISEIADAEAPHTPRGAPFQAWSLGELLRLMHSVLAEESSIAVPAARTEARTAVVSGPRGGAQVEV